MPQYFSFNPTQPNPSHILENATQPNPAQPNPWMDPTHVHLCSTFKTLYTMPPFYCECLTWFCEHYHVLTVQCFYYTFNTLRSIYNVCSLNVSPSTIKDQNNMVFNCDVSEHSLVLYCTCILFKSRLMCIVHPTGCTTGCVHTTGCTTCKHRASRMQQCTKYNAEHTLNFVSFIRLRTVKL